jgi:hypothetical protein
VGAPALAAKFEAPHLQLETNSNKNTSLSDILLGACDRFEVFCDFEIVSDFDIRILFSRIE